MEIIVHSETADGRPGNGGVCIILHKILGCKVKGYLKCSERIILVSIDTRPTTTVIIQVYMLTTNEDEEETETMYDELNNIIEKVKSEVNVIILGHWNAIVGEGNEEGIVGRYGLGGKGKPEVIG